MDNRFIFLTAAKENGQAFIRPRVVAIPEESITEAVPSNTSGLLNVRTNKGGPGGGRSYILYEKLTMAEAARNPSTTDVYLKSFVKTGIAAAGTVQGTGTALTGYVNEVLTLTVASADGVVLPAATVGKVCVVINNAPTSPLKIYPAVGEFIDSALVNVNTTLVNNGKRKHFVCVTTAGKWITADDYTV